MRAPVSTATLLLALPLLLTACGPQTVPNPGGNAGGEGAPLAQAAAQVCTPFEPGCGQDPIPAAGCYVECSADADCGAGEACQARSINPCPADPNGGPVCTACGMQVQVCVAATQPPPPPPPPACTNYEPGCGQDPIPAAGCYVECSADADCGAGEACQARSINPCPADPNGGPVCTACGMQVQVCVAATQPPPPPPPPACTNYEPGCGQDPIPAAGCYAQCAADSDCGAGEACESRSINPCPSDPNGGPVCTACGMQVQVCVAATQPPPTKCTDYLPGCGPNPIPAAGCYQTCAADSDCSAGAQCQQRSINPCPPSPNGGAVCLACGMQVGVCL